MNGNHFRPKGRMTLRIIGTALALGLLVYLLFRQGWGEISAVIGQISLEIFLLVILMTVLSRTAVGGRWHVLLRSAGVDISLHKSVSLTFAGLFASNFLPTTIGGDVVRLAGVLRLNLNRPVCIASLVVDRLVGMVAMATVLPFIAPGLARGLSSTAKAPLLAGAPVLSNLDLPSGGKVKKLWEKVGGMLHRLFSALSFWIKHPRSLLVSLLLSWVHMLLLFGTLWILLRTMGEPQPLWLIAGMWSLTYFVTLLPVSINGLGVQELSMTFLFTQIGGVAEPTALTLAFLIRILQMFASLPGAFYLPDVLAGRDSLSA
jgi:glycosyltransferase 2 family protein